jgi:hypothetical protein
MPSHKTNDAKRVREFDIETYRKGFVVKNTLNDIITQEYFQFKEIQKIIYYPDTGVEIININGDIRVFYNDSSGASAELFDALNDTMIDWMKSNLN